jgi:hypothetical protein
MAWKLEGTYFENCNCDWVCLCSVTSLTAPSTYDRCQVVLTYHVKSGQVDGVDVSGLTVALVADTPKRMLDGNWRLGLILDEKASKEQHEKLAGVFSGQMGGPPAGLGPLIGEVLGVESAPMKYSDDGLRHSVSIGSDVEIAVEDFVPPQLQGGEPTRLVGVFHPANTTITIAKPTRSRIKAFGMEFHNEGRSAFSGPFSWSG